MKLPSASCRSVPFWGWNARISEEGIDIELEEFHKQGLGGFFIHSREGLETPYLSDEWMQRVQYSVQQAKTLGLESWIYDEDKWPSGSAGGMVGATNRDFIAKGLTFAIEPVLGAADRSDEEIIGAYRWDDQTQIILRCETSRSSEWYNGLFPTDMLNPDAVKEFLTKTHEVYYRCLGEHFGETIKGFFTDEPNCYDFFTVFEQKRPWIPWTNGFSDFFRDRRGYDPRPFLPFLFLKEFVPLNGTVSCAQFRHDYWWTLTERLSESYFQQLYRWCEEHGVRSAGHLLYENDFGYQIRVSGASMPHYRYLHAPSVDILGEQIGEYLTLKQCASVANQYGRTEVFAEVYGCTGWQLSFDGQRWLMNWLFALGATRMCQHLALYSITGCRKRDYPPVFQYQAPWWSENKLLEDMRGRIAQALMTGRAIRNILVIHPITSLWCECGSSPEEDLTHIEMNMGWKDATFTDLNREGDQYNRLAEALTRQHFDFDFGDEIILNEAASAGNGIINVGQAGYSCVIVPAVASLLGSTAHLLRQFAESGGEILWIKPFPTMLEGSPEQERLDALQATLKHSKKYFEFDHVESLLAYMSANRQKYSPISIVDHTFSQDREILSSVRRADDRTIVFLANTDRSKVHETIVRVDGANYAEEIDLMSGEVRILRSETSKENGCSVYIELPATASRLLVFRNLRNQSFVQGKVDFPYRHLHAADEIFCSPEQIEQAVLSQENSLVLDTCCYALGTEQWSDSMEVWLAQRAIRQRLNLQPNHYNGAPQRYAWLEQSDAAHAPFSLKFSFQVDEAVEEPVFLAVENAADITVLYNGRVCQRTERWWIDRAIGMFRLDNLQKGDQSVIVQGEYRLATELENVFLVGNFSVSTRRHVLHGSPNLTFGDWTKQGLLHYGGTVRCEFTAPAYIPENDERIMLRAPSFQATLLKILVNGSYAGAIINSTEELDITPYLSGNENRIHVEVIGHLRNVFGPFHAVYNGCSRISWADFRTEEYQYTPEYKVVPFGLMEPIILTRRRKDFSYHGDR